jgi:hypothetical protein
MTETVFKTKVEDASNELAHSSYSDIQKDTAYKWAARAAASYKNVLTATDKASKVTTYILSQEYEHEAIEHAALVPMQPEDVVSSIQSLLSEYQIAAWSEVEMVLGL